ncbi:MAG: hypothetical protein IJX91_02815 [Clostridia bacterium]|nr:hypothetical protein [Clostridia bacterium]
MKKWDEKKENGKKEEKSQEKSKKSEGFFREGLTSAGRSVIIYKGVLYNVNNKRGKREVCTNIFLKD